MAAIDTLTLEVDDPARAEAFYRDAFGLDRQLGFRAHDAQTSGFRGFTLSLVVSQPADVRALIDAAVSAGAGVAPSPRTRASTAKAPARTGS